MGVQDVYDQFIAWCQKNWLLLVIIVGGVFLLLWIYEKMKKRSLKPLDRGEVERKKFIDRMKLNKTQYKYLYRGNIWLGRIDSMRFTFLTDREKEHKTLEMVVKPALINIKDSIRLVNPFGKEFCILAGTESMTRDSIRNELNIDSLITFDKYLGIYYDREHFEKAVPHILADTQFRTDWEVMASAYYAKAQEMAVYDVALGYRVLMEQIKLEQEKERRARATEGTQ